MEQRLIEVLQGKATNYILPFFWQHGESKALLEEGMEKIHDSGIGAVCVESRTHPDFAGEGWWRDLDVILAKAKELGMRVWVLDDAHFPSGFCNGKITLDSPYGKVYLTKYGVDFVGPKKGQSVFVMLEPGEELVAVTMGRRDREDANRLTDVCDLTDRVTADGRVFVDVEEGLWCVYVIKTTRKGTGRKNYINTIDHDAVRYFIEQIYEPHYAHYKDDFGKTFAGFFSDEPEIGNFGGEYGHDANIGKPNMKLPWSRVLKRQLKELWGVNFAENLTTLWTTPDTEPGQNKSGLCRMQFANLVALLYGENFCQQIGDWCRAHSVEYIGHVIEDSGTHAHMGVGAGHYFHALWGQDMAGIDVVLQQIRPGLDDCRFHSVGGELGYHGEMYHYTLAKLGTSLAHLDPKKHGRSLCEVFGAYGWAEGLKLMKWLLDHMLVNGVNYFVPHAFTMKKFPDPDCPPHFYARGMNPQFPYFRNLMEYCNRVCHLICGGAHVPAVAVVYPAEQEWAGAYLPVETVGKELLRAQIDYEILPIDALVDMSINQGQLQWGNEQASVLILMGSQCIPEKLAGWLNQAAKKGLQIVIAGPRPAALQEDGSQMEWIDPDQKKVIICEPKTLPETLRLLGIGEVKTKEWEPWLRYYHYRQKDGDFWLFMNQSETDAIHTELCLRQFCGSRNGCWYDAWENTVKPCEWIDEQTFHIHLETGEMKILYTGNCMPFEEELTEKQRCMQKQKAAKTAGKMQTIPLPADSWTVETKETGTKSFVSQPDAMLGDFCRNHPHFCGVMRYETTFVLSDTDICELDLGEVYETVHLFVNGEDAGVRVAPPYQFDISKWARKGENHLTVEVVNTLANRQRDFFSMTMPIEPSGLIGPVNIRVF